VRAIIWKKKDESFDAAAGNIRSVLKRLFDYAQAGGSELVMPGRGSLTKPFAHNAITDALKNAPQRREMLQFWADTIEQLMTTGQVVLGRFKQVAMDDRRVRLAR
jgi:hypothetical protein